MKVIIPLAGKGTRLRPHTHVTPKPMLRVAGKPVMDYILEDLGRLGGVEQVVYITGHLKEAVERHAHEALDVPSVFVEQKVQDGTAGAVALARPYVDQPVLIVISERPAVVASVPRPHCTSSGTWTSAPNIAAPEKNAAAELAVKGSSPNRLNGKRGSAVRRSTQTILAVVSALIDGPPPPSNIVLRDNGDGTRTLIWGEVPGATGYVVALRPPNSMIYQQFETTEVSVRWDGFRPENYAAISNAAKGANGLMGALSNEVLVR